MKSDCPYCGKSCDAHETTEGDSSPSDGDYSMCLYCGNFSIFEGQGRRKPTEDEARAVRDDKDAQKVWAAWYATSMKRRFKATPWW